MVDNSSSSHRGLGTGPCVEVRGILNISPDVKISPDVLCPSLVDVLETVLLYGCINWGQQLLEG